MRVLITNITLSPPSGTVVFTRDLALELKRQGHEPIVFSAPHGAAARELEAAGILVVRSLGGVRRPPDVIHGHHIMPTNQATWRWPTVPAIYICHDHVSHHDIAPRTGILRYFGVSELCVERLVREGAVNASLLLNFVDTARFAAADVIADRPRRALLFSNYAHAGTQLPAVQEACRRAGLELDVVGLGIGAPCDKPERVLSGYDIVFAKAKAAMEAMAVGRAVVLCDFAGTGPMVTSRNFDALRPLNFGFAALVNSLAPEWLEREIAQYDAREVRRVRDRIRESASLESAVRDLVSVYREVIEEVGRTPRAMGTRATPPNRNAFFLPLFWSWLRVPVPLRNLLDALPAFRPARRRIAAWLRSGN